MTPAIAKHMLSRSSLIRGPVALLADANIIAGSRRRVRSPDRHKSSAAETQLPSMPPVAQIGDYGGEDQRAEMDRFATMSPTPVSLRSVLETNADPWEAAKFLHSEFPVRCAERIRMIETIPRWQEVRELAEAHGRHVLAFWRMRAVRLHGPERLDNFTDAVRDIVTQNHDMVGLMSRGVTSLYRTRGDDDGIDAEFVDGFLNEFLLNRLGSNVLMKQYLACADGGDGIVDPNCDVAKICRETAAEVRKLCRDETGRCPPIRVEAFSADSSERRAPKFSYIPLSLSYILREILKNSCRATVDAARSDPAELQRRPVSVVVCADERRMMISISDRGDGIPFDVTPHVWSYLYSTTRQDDYDPTDLAGYGVGLPISRLYARYLGGDINLVTLPGYGTHSYVFLPRLPSEQVEIIPNKLSRHRDYRRDFVL